MTPSSSVIRSLGRQHAGIPSPVTVIIRILTLVSILATVPVVQASPDESPTQSVRRAMTELLHILKAHREGSRPDERRMEVEQLIRRHVSYADMAQRCLGEPWWGLADDQRQEFVDLFVQMLRDALANRMVEYSDERIMYLSEQREHDWANVTTRLSGRKADTFVDFRLTLKDGQWVLYDAVIDGASMVRNYRSQFATVLRQGSYADMVNRMKQRTLMVKVFEEISQ